MSRGWRWVAMLVPGGILTAWGGDFKILPGHVPALLSRLAPRGQLAATNEMHLAIGLPLHPAAGLETYLAEVYDPASPHYRQFLSPDGFTARFGPTEADYAAVKEFARTNGLTVTTTYANRLVLDVTGPAGAVEKAFHLTLRTYRHPTEARDFYAPDAEPRVDAALPVADIQGLSDYWRPHPRLVVHPGVVGKVGRTRQLVGWSAGLETCDTADLEVRDTKTPPTSSGRAARLEPAVRSRELSKFGSAPDGSGSYFGDDFRNAYVPGTTLTGAGQSVGLLEFDGFYTNDIAAYAVAAGNGRTNIAVQMVLVDDFDGTPTGASGDGEVSVDIEMAMAMAPGLAAIVVFEAPQNGSQNDLLEAMLAASGTVKNLSCSWGWGGGPSGTTDNIFTNMAAVGQSFFNASGDSDAFTSGTNSVNGVDNPALENAPSSCPIITQVGGTTLTMLGSGAAYGLETAWNRDVEFGSGDDGQGSSGGISADYAIPGWQANLPNLAGAGGSTTLRNIPDVALTAENIYVIYGGSGGGTGGNGGTSCAAPLWAGFTALVNEQAAANGKSPVGFINPALYAIAEGPNYAACFHDVTTGNNTWSGSPNAFYATNGYDLCTGLGTPKGTNLINALAGFRSLTVTPLAGAAIGVGGGPFQITSGNFQLTNAEGFALAWSLINPAAWLEFPATNGILAAGTETNLTASLTAAADELPVGSYTAGLIFSNATFATAQTGEFTLQVNSPLGVSPTNGLAAAGPVGGPFGVAIQSYTLTNLSIRPLPWSLSNAAAWLAAVPTGGTLPAGAQTNLTISLTAAANQLAAGNYTAKVLVTDPFGVAATRPCSLNVRPDLVDNGGFETGDFTGWTLKGSSAFNQVTTGGGFVHSGSHGVELGQVGSPGYLAQTLTTTPGQNYLLSLWLDNPTNSAGATPNQFFVQWNGATVFYVTNLPFLAWTNLQLIVTATAAGTPLQLGFEDDAYFLGLDDISVTPLAPPEFWPPQIGPDGFQLTWSAVPNLWYQLQYNTNLLQNDWLDLGAPRRATANTLTFSDTNAGGATPNRFYRVIQQP